MTGVKTPDSFNGTEAAAAPLPNAAVAEIEMDDEDANISLDLPNARLHLNITFSFRQFICFYRASDSNIPQLFAAPNRVVTPGMRILPFYIWVEEEADTGAQAGDHELRLLTEYRAREAVEAVQGQPKHKTKGSGGGDEEL